MGISNNDITAPAFRPDATPDYELSILTGVDSFVYVIRNRITNQLLAYHRSELPAVEAVDRPARLAQLVEADVRLRDLRYGNVLLGWDTPAFTLVPDDLFDGTQARSYLEQLTVVGLEDEVRHETYHELGSSLVYVARRDDLLETARLFHTPRIQHYAGGLLTAWASRARRLQHEAISCSVRGKRLLLAGHRNGKLLYYNTFTWESSQDAVYYLLLAYTQAGFSPSRAALYLSGEIGTTDELYYQFYRYVEDIRFSVYPVPPTVGPILEELPPHRYFDLLCLA
ncbi:hypothetical protein LEM8419_02412 [Neolewinella maritima]|uniref:DUF3822 family protein n=1 Tax=Neolewinella maritima TaxID=1383882 RepID=A0ABN8F8B2_9BACT|nr:DUF3822 family protein [Neolewinella maritima]CAH1001509.1 hypothetical protein LEM8419_02412 [Neolewinella maritima]